MDRKVFYNSIRSSIGLTEQNVQGFEKVLDYAEQHKTNPRFLPNILAQAFWESGRTMWPVREAFWLSEAWRKQHLRYYPFYGRGLIQTTWQANYAKMGKIVKADLVKHPELLLDWEYALPALFIGMEEGIYTGKKLSDYIDDKDEPDAEDYREFVNARRIVNGTDRAQEIAKLALVFEHALGAAKYGAGWSA